MRKPGFHMKNGYVVMAVPDSGLFVKNNRLVTGHGTDMVEGEMTLFSRRADAENFKQQRQDRWPDGDTRGHKWNFQIIPVLVSERL